MRIEAEQMWGYFQWLFQEMAIVRGVIVGAGVAVLAFVICFLFAVAKHGPAEGFYHVTKVIYDLLGRDLPGTLLRRVVALARLSFQEAIRRRVLVVLAVFVVGVLFAGWFLDPGSSNVAQLYISFVLTATSYLVLFMGLFLSCFSLPTDIKNKTVQTIVTKPVRCTEIILGRIFGFTAVGTLMLVFMGLLSYAFVVQGIKHSHDIESTQNNRNGTTTYDSKHAHTFQLVEDGSLGVTNVVKGHSHVVRRKADGSYEIGEPEGLLNARIPIFGSLHMTDRSGQVVTRGLNVGYESEYHTFIEGNSSMSAVWTFKPVGPSQFSGGDSLPVELTLQAFRTFKGDIVTGVRGEIFLRNEKTGTQSERKPFIVKEFSSDTHEFAAKLPGTKEGVPQEIDLWNDICKDEWQVVVRCTDGGQYFGMSTADLYLRAGDSLFGWNMFKGFVGIWLQMFIVICLGVMFSTFLSGPVAMVATIVALVLSYFGAMSFDVATGVTPGGGPIESLIRMPMHTSSTVDFDLGNKPLELIIKSIDKAVLFGVWTLFQALPSLGDLNTSEFVAYGYNIPGSLVWRHVTVTAAYFVLCSIVGYFFLKTRELASA